MVEENHGRLFRTTDLQSREHTGCIVPSYHNPATGYSRWMVHGMYHSEFGLAHRLGRQSFSKWLLSNQNLFGRLLLW